MADNAGLRICILILTFTIPVFLVVSLFGEGWVRFRSEVTMGFEQPMPGISGNKLTTVSVSSIGLWKMTTCTKVMGTETCVSFPTTNQSASAGVPESLADDKGKSMVSAIGLSMGSFRYSSAVTRVSSDTSVKRGRSNTFPDVAGLGDCAMQYTLKI